MSLPAPRSLRVLVTAVTLALLALAPPSPAADKWIEVTTPHFVVVSNAGKGKARDIGRQFEQIRHVTRLLLPWARRESGRPLIIFALRREKDMKELAPSFWEDGGNGVAGTYASGAGNDYVAIRADVRLRDDLSANPYFFAFWGYASSVIEYSFPGRLPPWYQRGLSDLLANTLVRGKDVHLGRPIPHHLNRLKSVGQISPADLFGANWDSKYLTDDSRRRIFDAHAWVTVHYLLFGDQGAHRPRLDAYTGMLLAGQPPGLARQDAFGDLRTLTDPVAQYAAGRVLPYLAVEADLNLRDKDFPVRDLPPAEFLAYRGAFHVATGRPVEATACIESISEVDPHQVFGTEVEALLLDRNGTPEKALAVYERAIDGGSESYWTHYRRARLLYRRGASKETLAQVVASLRRAVELNPEHARSLAFLARALSDLEPGDGAVVAARQAVSLEPTAVSHRLALTKALWESGQRNGARLEAEAALSMPADHRVRQEAERLARSIRESLAVEGGTTSPPITEPATTAAGAPEGSPVASGDVAPDPAVASRVRAALEPLKGSRTFRVDSPVSRAIADMGRAAVPELLAIIGEAEYGESHLALYAMGAADALALLATDEDLPALAALLADGHLAGARALVKLEGTAVRDALLVPLSKGYVYSDLTAGLSRFQDDPEVRAALVTYLQEFGLSDDFVPGYVAELAGAAGVMEAVPVLTRLVRESRKGGPARRMFASALVALHDPLGVATLVEIFITTTGNGGQDRFERHRVGEALNGVVGESLYVSHRDHSGRPRGNFEEAADEFRGWWDNAASSLHWDEPEQRWAW